MIYRGKEKVNHQGSHVRYYHCGEWKEGTLLEPVNYQIVVTLENPPAVLSCTTPDGYPEVERVEITDGEPLDPDFVAKAVEHLKAKYLNK